MNNSMFCIGKSMQSKRPSSRNRHIAPALISAGMTGLTTAMQLLGKSKEQSQQRKQMATDTTNKLNSQFLEQQIGDLNAFNEVDLDGETVNYYAAGGKIPSIGGYNTKGGDLVPIGDGVEEVVGNKHNETTIDGVSGVQLSTGNAPVAEVENKEILVDGNKVISDRLKYDSNNSYADKMRQITKKRNTLEAQQEKSKGFRAKNSIERKLASLNMAEDALFATQEAHKMAEGTATLNGLPSFANGGKIPGQGEIEDHRGWIKLPNGNRQHPTNKDVIIDANGMPLYDYRDTNTNSKVSPANNRIETAYPVKTTMPLDTTKPSSTPIASNFIGGDKNIATGLYTDNVSPIANKSLPIIDLAKRSTTASPTIEPTTVPVVSTATEGTSKFNDFVNSSSGTAIATALPGVASGIGAIMMANSTPKLPTPLMNRAEPMETRINVNPQIGAVRGSVKATVDNVLGNTSSSNNAKANIANTRLRGAAEISGILTNKNNQEISMRNADSQNKQNVANSNNAIANNHSMTQYQRLNDIRTMKSAGYSHITGAIQNGLTAKKMEDNYNGYVSASLNKDNLGEKMATMIDSPDFLKNPTYRSMALEMAKTNSFIAEKLKKLGYL